MEFERKPMSLLELCVRKAIDNTRHLGSVDGIETDLLKRVLPHCTMEHLTNIECATKMDISPVTDPLWKRFYQREFGQEHFNKVVERLKDKRIVESDEKYTWWRLFEARKKRQAEAEDEMVEKFTRKIQAEKAEKLSKQTKPCTKVPPSKRSFFGGGGPSSLSNCSYKSPMLKKARMEADSRARLQSAIQKNTFARSSKPIRTTSFSGQPVRTTTIHRPNSTITVTKPIGASRLQTPISTIAKPMGASRQIQNSTFTKPIGASSLQRPNSTITRPMGESRPIQNSTFTKPIGASRLQTPISTIANPMGASRQIQNSTFTKPIGASSLQRPNSTITRPMGESRPIQNSTFTRPMGASSLQRPNSTITKPIGASRQIQNSTFTKSMGASSLQRANSTITRPMGASRQIQNSRPKF